MTKATENPPESPEKVTLSGVGEITEKPSNLTAYLDKFDKLRANPTYKEVQGATLTKIILFAIIAMTAVFLIGWGCYRPTIAEVQQLLGDTASSEDHLETLQTLRAEHLNTFRDLFQLVVSSVLLPVFTLLAGYVFGSQEASKSE